MQRGDCAYWVEQGRWKVPGTISFELKATNDEIPMKSGGKKPDLTRVKWQVLVPAQRAFWEGCESVAYFHVAPPMMSQLDQAFYSFGFFFEEIEGENRASISRVEMWEGFLENCIQ